MTLYQQVPSLPQRYENKIKVKTKPIFNISISNGCVFPDSEQTIPSICDGKGEISDLVSLEFFGDFKFELT